MGFGELERGSWPPQMCFLFDRHTLKSSVCVVLRRAGRVQFKANLREDYKQWQCRENQGVCRVLDYVLG